MKLAVDMNLVKVYASMHGDTELDVCMECSYFNECDEFSYLLCPLLEEFREVQEIDSCR